MVIVFFQDSKVKKALKQSNIFLITVFSIFAGVPLLYPPSGRTKEE